MHNREEEHHHSSRHLLEIRMSQSYPSMAISCILEGGLLLCAWQGDWEEELNTDQEHLGSDKVAGTHDISRVGSHNQ